MMGETVFHEILSTRRADRIICGVVQHRSGATCSRRRNTVELSGRGWCAHCRKVMQSLRALFPRFTEDSIASSDFPLTRIRWILRHLRLSSSLWESSALHRSMCVPTSCKRQLEGRFPAKTLPHRPLVVPLIQRRVFPIPEYLCRIRCVGLPAAAQRVYG